MAGLDGAGLEGGAGLGEALGASGGVRGAGLEGGGTRLDATRGGGAEAQTQVYLLHCSNRLLSSFSDSFQVCV